MARTLSSTMREAMFSQETGEVLICLLTVTHPELSEPLYLSSDATRRVSLAPLMYVTDSRSREYTYVPFQFTLPEDKADTPPRLQISIDNTDRALVAVLRSFTEPASILVELVLASSPDIVEIDLPVMLLSNVNISAENVVLELIADALVAEPFPSGTFTPGQFPGLF